MPEAWSKKRERQYEHIKDSQLDRALGGRGGGDRRPHREQDPRSGGRVRRGQPHVPQDKPLRARRPRSHSGAQGRTKEQLYEDAKPRASRAVRP